jgi:hypothetical protein
MIHPDIARALLVAQQALVKMPPRMTVTEWCEQNLYLTSLQTDTPGRYSTRLTPYNREVLEDMNNPNVESETLCFGAQTGKTMTMMACLAWVLVNNPRPSIWVMPNKDLASAFSETRLQPLFEECEELMSRRHPDRHKYKKLQMEFIGAVITLIGSNSPANLASRPAGVLIMDETDKFAAGSDKEANAIELAEMRTRTYAAPKIFKTSTPSTVEAPIWRSFMAGSMHRFGLPCPHCEQMMVLSFNPDRSALPRIGSEATLKWDKRAKGPSGWDYELVERTAHYECPSCKKPVEEKYKTSMLRNGEWMPTNPYAEPRAVSRHLPTMYAPWKKASWGRLAVEFLQAKRGLEGLKGFINGTLSEPDMGQWEGGGGGRKESIVSNAEPLVKTSRILTCDRQIDHHWWVCREWAPGGDSRLVEWGRAETADDIEEVRMRLNVAPDLTCIDSGFEGSIVYQECARFGWFAIRGDERESWPEHSKDGKKKYEVPFTTRIFDPYIGTNNQGKRRIAELRWSNPTIKDILERLRNSKDSPVKWEVPEKLATEEYWRHLDGEFKDRVFNRNTGKVKHMWVKRSRHWPNHLLDCEAEQIAVALKVGLLRQRGK